MREKKQLRSMPPASLLATQSSTEEKQAGSEGGVPKEGGGGGANADRHGARRSSEQAPQAPATQVGVAAGFPALSGEHDLAHNASSPAANAGPGVAGGVGEEGRHAPGELSCGVVAGRSREVPAGTEVKDDVQKSDQTVSPRHSLAASAAGASGALDQGAPQSDTDCPMSKAPGISSAQARGAAESDCRTGQATADAVASLLALGGTESPTVSSVYEKEEATEQRPARSCRKVVQSPKTAERPLRSTQKRGKEPAVDPPVEATTEHADSDERLKRSAKKKGAEPALERPEVATPERSSHHHAPARICIAGAAAAGAVSNTAVSAEGEGDGGAAAAKAAKAAKEATAATATAAGDAAAGGLRNSTFKPVSEEKWKSGFENFKKWIFKFGHPHPANSAGWDGKRGIGRWTCDQRGRFRNNILSANRIMMLREIGFCFDGAEAAVLRDIFEAPQNNTVCAPPRAAQPQLILASKSRSAVAAVAAEAHNLDVLPCKSRSATAAAVVQANDNVRVTLCVGQSSVVCPAEPRSAAAAEASDNVRTTPRAAQHSVGLEERVSSGRSRSSTAAAAAGGGSRASKAEAPSTTKDAEEKSVSDDDIPVSIFLPKDLPIVSRQSGQQHLKTKQHHTPHNAKNMEPATPERSRNPSTQMPPPKSPPIASTHTLRSIPDARGTSPQGKLPSDSRGGDDPSWGEGGGLVKEDGITVKNSSLDRKRKAENYLAKLREQVMDKGPACARCAQQGRAGANYLFEMCFEGGHLLTLGDGSLPQPCAQCLNNKHSEGSSDTRVCVYHERKMWCVCMGECVGWGVWRHVLGCVGIYSICLV